MKPPTPTASSISLGTGVSATFATNVGNASDRELTIIGTNNFDILFSDDGTSDIPVGLLSTTNIPFLARTLCTFQLGPKNTHFRIAVATSVNFKYWLSSRT